MPDEEAITVMLKANFRCWIKVHNPEESAPKTIYIFISYPAQQSWSVLRKTGMNIKLRGFVCAEEDKGIYCEMWIDFRFA